jgi:hypothetical protein
MSTTRSPAAGRRVVPFVTTPLIGTAVAECAPVTATQEKSATALSLRPGKRFERRCDFIMKLSIPTVQAALKSRIQVSSGQKANKKEPVSAKRAALCAPGDSLLAGQYVL